MHCTFPTTRQIQKVETDTGSPRCRPRQSLPNARALRYSTVHSARKTALQYESICTRSTEINNGVEQSCEDY